MATSPDIVKSIRALEVKFHKYNDIRLNNLKRSLSEQELIYLLEFIPYLLSVNIPELPGYVASEKTPFGVFEYGASQKLLDFIAKRFGGLEAPRGKATRPFIQMIALIGSCGTIAYTRQSDFDFWLCYKEDGFDRDAIQQFRLKLRGIENWIFENLNMEIHFYLNEIGRVKDNIFADDKEQLSGSSIGELLKEEFLRSSIIITGKIPFWWVTPVNSDNETYEAWLAAAMQAGLANVFIDLGNIFSIRQEDFLAAGLFQILKSLGNPFKSIMKLGLLERYISNHMENPFICNIIKSNIHDDRLGHNEIDAYLIMFDTVYDYFSSIIKDKDALEVLKTSFYLKVEPMLSRHLSRPHGGYEAEKTRIMLDYVKKWNWSGSKIKEMDNFNNWSIEPVSKLLNNAKKFVLQEYRRILGFIETQKVKHRFTDEEIKAISRKISSHFLVADNKIDNTLSFKNYPPEKLLKIEYMRDKKGNETWFLSKRLIVDNTPNIVILHKDKTLLGLSVWVSMNGLFKKDYTRLEIDTGLHSLETNFLRELISDISTNFMFKKINAFQEDYLRDPYPVISYIIFNLYSKYSRKIDEIFLLYHDSWGSTKFEVFNREMDLLQVLVRILNGGMVTRADFDGALNVVSSSPFSSTKDFMRLKGFIRDIYGFFIEGERKAKKSYVTMMGNQHIVIYTKHSAGSTLVDSLICESEMKMLYSLSFNYGIRSEIRVDPSIKELQFLKTIVESHVPGTIQIFFDNDRKYSYFYVLDEGGSLYFFRKPAEDLFDYLTRLYLFATDVTSRVLHQNQNSLLRKHDSPVGIFQLKKDLYMNYTVHRVDPEHSMRMVELQKSITPLLLSVTIDAKKEVQYRVTLPDGRLSNPFSRATIGSIAGQLVGTGPDGKEYRPFVTSIDLSSLKHAFFQHFTSYAFYEKIRAELMLEGAQKIAGKRQ